MKLIGKGQFFLSWKKHVMFSLRRAHGHAWEYLRNRIIWHWAPKFKYTTKFPDHVDLELASLCDMKCPMCYTITDLYNERVPKKMMKPELFKKVVDQCAENGVYSIRLSLRGEPFLHKDIVELTRYAKSKGIKEVSTLSNGLRLNPEIFTQMMEAGLDWLTISFDGMGETYNKIRKPAIFDEAVEKIKTYHKIKKERGSIKPLIKLQAIWPSIKDDPQAFYELFNPYVDHIASNPLIDYGHSGHPEYIEDFSCPILYQRLVIGSDGQVLLCSNDEYGRGVVGNVNTESLYDIWHGERMQKARDLHKKRLGYLELEPCKDCYLPRKTVKFKQTIDDKTVIVDKYIGNPDTIPALATPSTEARPHEHA